jgi:hypothetical protein
MGYLFKQTLGFASIYGKSENGTKKEYKWYMIGCHVGYDSNWHINIRYSLKQFLRVVRYTSLTLYSG